MTDPIVEPSNDSNGQLGSALEPVMELCKSIAKPAKSIREVETLLKKGTDAGMDGAQVVLVLAIVILLVFSFPGFSVFASWVAWVFPIYRSCQAVRDSQDAESLKKCLKYFVVYQLVKYTLYFADYFLSWFPLYSLLKIRVYFVLWHPSVNRADFFAAVVEKVFLKVGHFSFPTGNQTCPFFPRPEVENPKASQWFWLAFWLVLPGAITFSYSVFASLYHREWWAIAYNLPYNTEELKIPSVFEIHFGFAILMLIFIAAQLFFVWKGLWRNHKMNGHVVVMIIICAVVPGTVALALCDSAPKKGVETLFFVQLGICIILTTVKAYNAIMTKKLTVPGGGGILKESHSDRLERHQTHMRYMVWNLMLIFSPAYNRIWQMFWRTVNGWKPECYQVLTFTRQGVLYTPSFVIGLAYSFFVWAFCFRYPMFNVGELGWWQFWFFACTLTLCIVQMFFFAPDEYKRMHTCSWDEFHQYESLMNATLGKDYYATNMYMGICHSTMDNLYIKTDVTSTFPS